MRFTYRGYAVTLAKESRGPMYRAKHGSHVITIALPPRTSKDEYAKLLKEQIDRSIDMNRSFRH